jgi:FKBP-type peptidyl-prolyl cis-trans isomerase SlyD
VQVGGRYQIQVPGGTQVVLVKAVNGDYAQVDGNHPLAGKTLHFNVKIVEVRDATADEQEHGHIHDADGHGHHHH